MTGGWVRTQEREIAGKLFFTSDFLPGDYDAEKMAESDYMAELAFARAAERPATYPHRSLIKHNFLYCRREEPDG